MKGKIIFLLLLLLGIPLWADDYYPRNQAFYIEEIEREDGEISFDFAVPIDPTSVTSENIYVNNQPLPADVRIYFNRRGDEMKIREPVQWRNKVITLEIKKLRSASGKDITPSMVFRLRPDEEIELDDWYDDDWDDWDD